MFAFDLNYYVTRQPAVKLDIIYTKLILIRWARDLIEEVDWNDILLPLHIHCAWKLFTKKSTAFIDECIPQDIPRKKNIFMNHRAINLRNRKRKLWNKYIQVNLLMLFSSENRAAELDKAIMLKLLVFGAKPAMEVY